MSLKKVAGYVGEDLAFKVGQKINCFACGYIDEKQLKSEIQDVSGGKVIHLSLNNVHHTHNLKVEGCLFPALTVFEHDPMTAKLHQ